MKAIYQNKLYHIEEAEWECVVLEDGTRVPYSDPTLIIDPTDDEVDLCLERLNPYDG
ncbi:MAG TPA: hypothetical protein VGV87_06820 [Blastocatellia bacterium]|jgi:hypothetical protein|nr:hypothetical protein [Blastocatellia bacterium]